MTRAGTIRYHFRECAIYCADAAECSKRDAYHATEFWMLMRYRRVLSASLVFGLEQLCRLQLTLPQYAAKNLREPARVLQMLRVCVAAGLVKCESDGRWCAKNVKPWLRKGWLIKRMKETANRVPVEDVQAQRLAHFLAQNREHKQKQEWLRQAQTMRAWRALKQKYQIGDSDGHQSGGQTVDSSAGPL